MSGLKIPVISSTLRASLDPASTRKARDHLPLLVFLPALACPSLYQDLKDIKILLSNNVLLLAMTSLCRHFHKIRMDQGHLPLMLVTTRHRVFHF
jgi:hypothetical protein